jgi:hypothetical protein
MMMKIVNLLCHAPLVVRDGVDAPERGSPETDNVTRGYVTTKQNASTTCSCQNTVAISRKKWEIDAARGTITPLSGGI